MTRISHKGSHRVTRGQTESDRVKLGQTGSQRSQPVTPGLSSIHLVITTSRPHRRALRHHRRTAEPMRRTIYQQIWNNLPEQAARSIANYSQWSGMLIIIKCNVTQSERKPPCRTQGEHTLHALLAHRRSIKQRTTGSQGTETGVKLQNQSTQHSLNARTWHYRHRSTLFRTV